MKAICLRADNSCRWLLDDDAPVDLSGNPTYIDGGIVDIAGSVYVEHTNVTEMSGGVEVLRGTAYKANLWRGVKFTYDGTDWALNTKCVGFICSNCDDQITNAYNATNCSGCNAAVL